MLCVRADTDPLIINMYVVLPIAGGLKILGGFTDVYNDTSEIHYGRIYEWGSHQTERPGTKVLTVTHSYCWNSFTNSRGYSYQRLIASTQNDANEEHHEILGTKQVIMDAQSQRIDVTRHQYGQQSVGDGESDVTVYAGESWSPGNNAWGYAYLHFIVKKSTGYPSADAFSTQARNAGSEQFSQPEEFSGSPKSHSERTTIGHFRCWTEAWGTNSNLHTCIWRAKQN